MSVQLSVVAVWGARTPCNNYRCLTCTKRWQQVSAGCLTCRRNVRGSWHRTVWRRGSPFAKKRCCFAKNGTSARVPRVFPLEHGAAYLGPIRSAQLTVLLSEKSTVPYFGGKPFGVPYFGEAQNGSVFFGGQKSTTLERTACIFILSNVEREK